MRATEAWRHRGTGWGISLALHAGLFVGAGLWAVKPPVFGVQAGPASTEVELVAAPVPVPSDPAPVIPTPEAEDPEEPVPPEVPPPPKPEPPPPAPPEPRKAEESRENVAPSQGATQALPNYMKNPPPAYPEASRRAREEGVVAVAVELDGEGHPEAVSLARGSGYPRLDQAALRAVREWTFLPATLGGHAVASHVVVPVRFELK